MSLKILAKLIFVLIITSCNFDSNYFPHNEGKKIFYDVFFEDKEKTKKSYRQSFYFLPKVNNAIPVLKNDGEITFYVFEDEGIFKKNTTDFFSTNENQDRQLLIAFPIIKNTQWKTNDKTSLQMKLGYDRIYDTNLPFELTNKIESINETVSIDGKKIKNCIKISGYGKTSYNPGPPLDVINIEVFSTSWFAKGYGLVKYIREEKSDSETMGKIFYEKNMLIND